MVCPRCKKEIAIGSNFCSKCGIILQRRDSLYTNHIKNSLDEFSIDFQEEETCSIDKTADIEADASVNQDTSYDQTIGAETAVEIVTEFDTVDFTEALKTDDLTVKLLSDDATVSKKESADMLQLRYCKECGSPCDTSATLCDKCLEKQQSQQKVKNKKFNIILTTIILFLVIMLILGIAIGANYLLASALF